MRITQSDLEDLRSMEKEARELEQEIFWRDKLMRVTSQVSPIAVKSRRVSDQTGDTAASVMDLRMVLSETIEKINRKRIAAEKEIEDLCSEERRIIRLYYFNGWSDRKISWEISLNEEVVGRKRRHAVEKITGEGYQYGATKRQK